MTDAGPGAAGEDRPGGDDPAVVLDAVLDGLPAACRHLCVALSGGRDSSVLLHLAKAASTRRGLVLSALHVDHGLSPHASAWARHCATECDRLEIPFACARVAVDRDAGEGVEAAARNARYAAYRDRLDDVDVILLGHHAGDQAETLMFRLLRGSGVTGAAGMPASRPLDRASGRPLLLLRPLLTVSPEAIAAYARRHRITFVEDESNADMRYARNHLRCEILGRIEARFPGAGGRLAAAAHRLREASGLLDQLAAIDAERCRGQRGLDLASLAGLADDRRRNLLVRWLRRRGLAVPSEAWVREALRQLLGDRADALACIAAGGFELRAWRGEAVLVPTVEPPAEPVAWNGAGIIAWGGGSIRLSRRLGEGIAAAALTAAPVTVRPRSGGERLVTRRGGPRRTLKNLLQERGVPPWERPMLPCVWSGERLVWVGGVGHDASVAAAAGEPSWSIEWCPGDRFAEDRGAVDRTPGSGSG